VADGEGHESRGRPGRCEDQVALVLAVGVVDDNDGPALRDGDERLANPAFGGVGAEEIHDVSFLVKWPGTGGGIRGARR
jgi:hypothetical protein